MDAPYTAQFGLNELLQATGGALVTPMHWQEGQAARISTDTRTVAQGDFFLPLSGENFNGHDYLEKAFDLGVSGAFVAQAQFAAHPEWQNLPNLIAVPDPLMAYLQVARYHRQKVNPMVIALTGSSGKTTTKEMLYAAFSPLLRTQRTEKNFNNEVGVSQTLLALRPDTQLLIVEMGMRGLHQIDLLSEHALPDIALVVNVGPAHIGLLGSLENIALAKLEITAGLDANKGLLVVNGDDALLQRTASQLWQGRLASFTLSDAVDIQPTAAGGMRFTLQGTPVEIPLPGRHMVSNALAVLKVGELMGYSVDDLASGLVAMQAAGGRWEYAPLPGFENAYVINDAYNANPDSFRASLTTLLQTPIEGLQRVLVLGGMKELGAFSRDYHDALGRWLAEQSGIAALFTVGDEGAWIAEAAQAASYPVYACNEVAEVVAALHGQGTFPDNMLLFLKGSRAYRLDEIPNMLVSESLSVKGSAPR